MNQSFNRFRAVNKFCIKHGANVNEFNNYRLNLRFIYIEKYENHTFWYSWKLFRLRLFIFDRFCMMLLKGILFNCLSNDALLSFLIRKTQQGTIHKKTHSILTRIYKINMLLGSL